MRQNTELTQDHKDLIRFLGLHESEPKGREIFLDDLKKNHYPGWIGFEAAVQSVIAEAIAEPLQQDIAAIIRNPNPTSLDWMLLSRKYPAEMVTKECGLIFGRQLRDEFEEIVKTAGDLSEKSKEQRKDVLRALYQKAHDLRSRCFGLSNEFDTYSATLISMSTFQEMRTRHPLLSEESIYGKEALEKNPLLVGQDLFP